MNKLLWTSLLLAGIVGGTAPTLVHAQSTVGQYVDDTTVTTRVKARFAEDSQVSAMRINVETLKGTVQLSGFATSETEKARAAQIARSVPGVTNVRNDIVVRADGGSADKTTSSGASTGTGATASGSSSSSGATGSGSATGSSGSGYSR